MTPRKIESDAVGLHVLHNALANIAAEMAIVMMKTSYSTIFNEGLDFSTMLLDREGNLIAEKNFAPSMMGAVNYTLRWTLEELGENPSSSPAISSSTTIPIAATAICPSIC